MGASIRKTMLWLALMTLAIAAAALLAGGVAAAPGADAGGPPNDTTGELKIVKNLGGGWPDGAFIFTWECTDGQTGQATFPDAFTGANFISPQEYEIGTVCKVEETNGVLSVSDYEVTTSVEGSAFEAINPRNVPINNSVGLNTIQYKNTLTEPDPLVLEITKNLVGGPLSVSDFEFEISCDMGDFETTYVIASGNSGIVEVPASIGQCRVTEKPVDGYTASGDNGLAKQLGIEPTEWVITNTWQPPEPEDATVKVEKVFEGPDSWEFGFLFACANQQGFTSFALGGGESRTFDVEFGPIVVPVRPDNHGDDELPPGLPCAVVEEALVGDWTATVTVNGAALGESGSDTFGTFAEFSVQPGAEVVVTFTNIPGYAAQPPTGEITLPVITDGAETR